MKVKKLLALLLALAMVFALVACSSSDDDSSAADEEEAVAEEESEEEEAAEEEETSEDAEPADEEEAPADEEEAPAEDSSDSGMVSDIPLGDGEVWADLDYSKCDLSGYSIGYVTINSSAPWGGLVGTSFCEYAESCGATVESLDANTDADLVNQYVQQFIDEGVDAIAVFGGTPADMSGLAINAAEAGVGLFMCGLDADSATDGYDEVTAMIGPDQYAMCAGIAEYVVEQNGTSDDYNIYEINGVPFLQDYLDRTSGFEDYMADYSNYNFSGIEDCYSDRTAAKSATENWLTAGLSEGDIIMGYDDDLTMGAVQALEEAGLTGQVKVYSLTGQKDAMEAVASGELELTVLNPAREIGAGTVSAICEWLTTGSTARIQRTELTFVTPENVDDMLAAEAYEF